MGQLISYFIGYNYNFSADEILWGDREITLSPRCPSTRIDNEPKTPRICLAPSVAQALNALPDPSYKHILNYCCYRYESDNLVQAESVFDSEVSGELWALEPITLKYCYRIDPALVIKFFVQRAEPYYRDGVKYSLNKDKKNLTLARKLLAQYSYKNKP